MIKVLVVDDEIPAQNELTFIINQHPAFTVIGTASSAQEAVASVIKLKPQVAFLDIQLYDLNGLALAEKLTLLDKNLIIIFATAHDDFAVKAFELNAADYIVKPFDELRIYRTLERIKNLLDLRPTPLDTDNFPKERRGEKILNRICAEISCDKWSIIDSKDIFYLTVEERKTYVKLYDALLPTTYTMHELAERLDPHHFLRVHRAYLVNINQIKEFLPWFNGTYKLIMNDKQKSEIPVSKNYARDFRLKIGIS